MNKENRRKRMVFANKMQKEIFLLIFLAALLPAAIAVIFLYYLIFSITAGQLAIPEAIAYNIIPAAKKVITILFFIIPFCISVILIFSYRITHKIIGPFDRIVRELGECIKGKKQTHIRIRNSDKFWPLVDKINELLDKVKKK